MENKKLFSSMELFDIFIFFIFGYFIPFIIGDIIESIFSLILDVLIYIILKNMINEKYHSKLTSVLFLESLDIFDIFTSGNDVLGVIELLPSWIIFIIYIEHQKDGFKIKEEEKIFMLTPYFSELLNTSSWICNECESENDADSIYCYTCGKKIKT